MFFIKLIRYILGYVTFTASGGFSERFINLCSQKGIALWDVESRNGIISANTNISGYKNIRECASRSAMNVRIKEKQGLPFLIHKYRGRVGFLIGAVLFLLIIGLLSTRLWTIEVSGNDKISDKEIIQVFEKLGVSTGAKISNIDVTAVQEQALEELDELSWLALNISGSTATVEVRESVKKPESQDQTPCNIVANYGGQIIKLEVYDGTSQQELGAAVAKGDLLISGVIENLDGSAQLKHSKGLVIAKTERNLSNVQTEVAIKQVKSKEKKRYRLLFFGLDIPLFWLNNDVENAEYYRHEYKLNVSGNILPIGYVEEGYKTFEEKKIKINNKECEFLAFEGYTQLQNEIFDKIEILNEKVEVVKDDGNVSINGKYSCKENICTNQEIYLEK